MGKVSQFAHSVTVRLPNDPARSNSSRPPSNIRLVEKGTLGNPSSEKSDVDKSSVEVIKRLGELLKILQGHVSDSRRNVGHGEIEVTRVIAIRIELPCKKRLQDTHKNACRSIVRSARIYVRKQRDDVIENLRLSRPDRHPLPNSGTERDDGASILNVDNNRVSPVKVWPSLPPLLHLIEIPDELMRNVEVGRAIVKSNLNERLSGLHQKIILVTRSLQGECKMSSGSVNNGCNHTGLPNLSSGLLLHAPPNTAPQGGELIQLGGIRENRQLL
mmetsp:Transcript_24424/g.50941  ORF Transcript_24424/g.50941 Transcript_24424/m.50941 type:complete len:273 (-) Transcript_24424:1556-2374(-)